MRVSDPVFKKRLSFTDDQPLIKIFVILIVGIIIGMLGTTTYFLNTQNQTVKSISGGTQTVDVPTTVTPTVIVQDVQETESKKPPKVAAIPSDVVSEVVSSEDTSSDTSGTPETPKAQPESAVAPVTTAPAPPKTSPKSAEELLAQAKKQIAKKRFTSPAGNNAYETYHYLLQKAPKEAQSILDEIVTWYFEQGQKYLNRRRLTTPKKRGNAYNMYKKIHEIAPQHEKTQILLSEIIIAFNKRAKQQIEKERLTNPTGNNAYVTYQELQTIAPTHQYTKTLVKTLVNRLLALGKKQIDKSNFTTPKNDNAADTYKKILTISPNNAQAKLGIKKIAREYYQLALSNQKEKKYLSSQTWIKRGLRVDPENPSLIRIKQEVEEEIEKLSR
jgi:tetratricopeptide (TPR) repeat protein